MIDYVEDMAWAEPLYSKSHVDRAAITFMQPGTPGEREEARQVINNWRSSHSFPLNTMQVNLRNRATKVDPDALIAQRIKRLPSITRKLIDNPKMRLSRMQDIGGCRAVVSDVRAVEQVVDLFFHAGSPHDLVRQDSYIEDPKVSGYRGHHLVYRYRSDVKSTYNGLSIEVQVRTRAQHAWATAVETVGTFTRQALKSSHGEAQWLRFFALMSTAIAQQEGTASVPGTPTDPEALLDELVILVVRLDVFRRLQAFAETLQFADESTSDRHKYFVMELDVELGGSTLSVNGFRDQRAATEYFAGIERAAEERFGLDVVMVSVGALTSLRRAYPNYYLDTQIFREMLNQVIGGEFEL
jgi:Region found in RelA / SpoT proteins